jgi:hypothetical protein
MLGRLRKKTMKNTRVAILATGFLLLPLPAFATGGVWCDVEDQNVKFHVKASQARDGTGGWWGIEGGVETLSAALPPDLAKFDIKDEDITERWWDGDDVRLIVQKIGTESQSWASVRVTVLAKTYDEASYRGRYTLDVRNEDGSTFTRTGIVECSAD